MVLKHVAAGRAVVDVGSGGGYWTFSESGFLPCVEEGGIWETSLGLSSTELLYLTYPPFTSTTSPLSGASYTLPAFF